MLNEAQICLTGYVATQPVTKMVKPGVNSVSMRVAWTPRRQDRATGEWMDGNTSYLTVTCWRRLASNVALCVRTGDPVVIKGKLSVRTYDDKDGVRRTAVDLDASSVGHDLSLGVSEFRRVRPRTGMTASEFEAASAGGDGAGSASAGEPAPGAADAGEPRFGGAGAQAEGDGGAARDGGGDWNTAGSGQTADGPEPAFFDEAAISEHGASLEPEAVAL